MGPEILLCVGSALKSFVPANVAMFVSRDRMRGGGVDGGREEGGESGIGGWEGD